jgi:hypothetical protein
MIRVIAVAWLLSLSACSSTSDLSKQERAKVDPAVMRLLSGDDVSEKDYDVGIRSDGVKDYEVIIRANKTEELQSAGIKILSAFGDVLTARLTVPELRTILRLTSVRSVVNGSKNQLH